MFQSSQSNQQNQQNAQNVQIKEQDWANLVLSELKRTAREYTTAALEASHPAVRQTFQTLAQRTMQDQGALYTVISQMDSYGTVRSADQQAIQQELQQQFQRAEQLQSFVQQSLQSIQRGAGAFQQSANTAFQASQSFGQQAPTQAYQQVYTSGYGGINSGGSGPAGPGLGTSSGQYNRGASYSQSGQGYGQSSNQGPANYQNFSQALGGQNVEFADNAGTGYGQNQTSSSAGGRQGQASQSARSNEREYGTGQYAAGTDTYYSNEEQDSTRGGNSFDWHESEDRHTSAADKVFSQSRSGFQSNKQFL